MGVGNPAINIRWQSTHDWGWFIQLSSVMTWVWWPWMTMAIYHMGWTRGIWCWSHRICLAYMMGNWFSIWEITGNSPCLNMDNHPFRKSVMASKTFLPSAGSWVTSWEHLLLVHMTTSLAMVILLLKNVWEGGISFTKPQILVETRRTTSETSKTQLQFWHLPACLPLANTSLEMSSIYNLFNSIQTKNNLVTLSYI